MIPKKKYFIDTKFRELPNEIHLLSLGIACDDGRKFYIEHSEFPAAMFNEWLEKNVRPHLKWYDGDNEAPLTVSDRGAGDMAYIKNEVLEFIGGTIPEPWGYYADYDWVVFCWIFGSTMDLPKGWPMYCRDVKQMMDEAGNPKKPEQKSAEHNALDDAIYTMELHDWIIKLVDEKHRNENNFLADVEIVLAEAHAVLREIGITNEVPPDEGRTIYSLVRKIADTQSLIGCNRHDIESASRRIHRTLIQFEVLSEEPIPANMELDTIHHETLNGAWSGEWTVTEAGMLEGRSALDAVENQGRDPEFFWKE